MKLKRLIITVLVLNIFISTGHSQIQFEQVLQLPPAPQNIADFDGIFEGSIAFADVDADNDQDVLITGEDNFDNRTAKLYINDGTGNYIDDTLVPFEGVSRGSVAFADVDGDNDQDVLITGAISSNNRIAKLYINDGNGNFSELTGTSFEEVDRSLICFEDVDGDDDLDVLITGYRGNRVAELYLNDGNGNFSESENNFLGVSSPSILFEDVDGDNDKDLFIAGYTGSYSYSKLYVNDGSGIFSETANTFEGIAIGSCAFSDVDNDEDFDLLITGENDDLICFSKLYINDGIGNFEEVPETPLEAVRYSSIAFNDINGDNNEDLLITGENDNNDEIARLYINNGSGSFTEINEESICGVSSSSIEFADIDEDNDSDLLITGQSHSWLYVSLLYKNDGFGNFAICNGSPFEGVYYSSIATADIDGDFDKDLIIAGLGYSEGIVKLYTNDGVGNYSEVSDTPFVERANDVAFSDIDGDNDQDVFITGYDSTVLYKNDGTGDFIVVTNTPFESYYYSSVIFFDMDGDNDDDVLIVGSNSSGSSVKLYSNDGLGTFTIVSGTSFEVNYYEYGTVAITDVDGDYDKDILISDGTATKLYTNDGDGNFTNQIGTPFYSLGFSSVAFIDMDEDNDEDIIGLGSSSKVFINDGNGSFSEVENLYFDDVSLSEIRIADLDNDNYNDVLITGWDYENKYIAKLYKNLGEGEFAEIMDLPFEGVYRGSIEIVDIDADADSDVIITGKNNSGHIITKLYRNNTPNNLNESDANELFRLYPNPSNGTIYFEINDDNSSYKITINTIEGKNIRQFNSSEYKENCIKIDLSKGIYIVEIVSQEYKAARKLVIY